MKKPKGKWMQEYMEGKEYIERIKTRYCDAVYRNDEELIDTYLGFGKAPEEVAFLWVRTVFPKVLLKDLLGVLDTGLVRLRKEIQEVLDRGLEGSKTG